MATPTRKGHFRTEAAFLDSDKRHSHVPFQHYGDMAPITWARIRRPKGQRDAAHLICDACGGVHHEHDKPGLLAAGEWRQTALGDRRPAGFHLSPLYSPRETWAEIAQECTCVAKDPARRPVWVNTKPDPVGSGLVLDHSQNITVAANAIAERYVSGHPS
ncbi:phage terminase large subunit family protein [Paracoccus sp. ME4]|uniref:phage terminase large subunit family protein n=1 Tax=Paracoccus sp. ME4 TaxID=3138066 RepID=UPI00398B4ADE